MADNEQLINVPLWDRARWKGVAFRYDPSQIPFVALVFTDGDVGVQIVEAWRWILGEVDEHNILRLAFIEGDIPGEDAGYTVHIGMNPEGISKAATAAGKERPKSFLVASRIHRMPTPNSVHLAGFKHEFAKQRRYQLIAARLSPAGELLLAHNAFITKTDAVFKRVTDIGTNDIDKVIFVREAAGPQH
jgi:hypothetical protein